MFQPLYIKHFLYFILLSLIRTKTSDLGIITSDEEIPERVMMTQLVLLFPLRKNPPSKILALDTRSQPRPPCLYLCRCVALWRGSHNPTQITKNFTSSQWVFNPAAQPVSLTNSFFFRYTIAHLFFYLQTFST